MRALPRLGAVLAVSCLVLGGCALPSADSNEKAAPRTVELSFDYQAEGGEGYLDQTLTIANQGAAAGAPDLDLVALDAAGEPMPDVEVVTAFGSDRGEQVVPAFTEVIEVLKFKGPDAADVADVRVTVADLGTLDEDPPPANDIRIKRFDVTGKTTSDNTLGSVLVTNSYDKPIRVQVLGLELAPADEGEPQHFSRVTPLAGPLELAPGEKVREKVAAKYRLRFYGTVRAFLVR
ncbi:hypothetical protein [Nocardioides rubriscoriae]|uniref:hypothetical protein n=1 Tax=Nocardioides rubriscoriae TaxID=642762 RepID=UPI0011E04BD0|nr:hypothetical protein [Nocardioides rubriscoriae]